MIQIKFCPQRVEDDVFDLLYAFNLELDEIGDNERFNEIPEYSVRKIDDFDISGNRKEAEQLTKWAYEKFPWHFDVKREYYYSQLHAGNDLLFEDFFRKEINCLENDQDYGRVVSDDELHAMLHSVGKHYVEDGERQKLIDL